MTRNAVKERPEEHRSKHQGTDEHWQKPETIRGDCAAGCEREKEKIKLFLLYFPFAFLRLTASEWVHPLAVFKAKGFHVGAGTFRSATASTPATGWKGR